MDILNTLGNAAENILTGQNKGISVDEFAALWHQDDLGEAYIIDCREPLQGEPLKEKYPGRWHNIPQGQLRSRLAEVPRDKKLVLMRGFVHRAPTLDAQNEFVLYRLAIWCCFADATAVGFKVKLPAGSPPPADKSWLVAYGHLTEIPPEQRQEYTMPDMAFSSVAQAAIFTADHLEALPLVPEQAFMFEWRQGEPYAY